MLATPQLSEELLSTCSAVIDAIPNSSKLTVTGCVETTGGMTSTTVTTAVAELALP